MKNLFNIENMFNVEFDFENLKRKTQIYIEKILKELDNEFFDDDNDENIEILRSMRVKYYVTKLIINYSEGYPSFILKYNLYKENEYEPRYTYEVEYNMNGEFLDEYFLEY